MALCVSWAIYTPSTHPFEVVGLCGSAESARHLEYHIQSIQVLNCSSIDLHMLCVCVLSARLILELSECKVVPTL
jgi:hypothetical protein